MGDEEIEGAQSALPLDNRPQEGRDMRTKTADEVTRYPPADEIMTAESQYGDPGIEDKMLDEGVDDGKDNVVNTVVKETYYVQGDEELDYDDDAPAEEVTPVQLDDPAQLDVSRLSICLPERTIIKDSK